MTTNHLEITEDLPFDLKIDTSLSQMWTWANLGGQAMLAGFGGNHLCNTTRLTQVFFKSGDQCSKL